MGLVRERDFKIMKTLGWCLIGVGILVPIPTLLQGLQNAYLSDFLFKIAIALTLMWGGLRLSYRRRLDVSP